MPQVSVIIPTYNRPAELTNCIQSILTQSEKPDEVIIIDDGALPAPPLQKECTERGIYYLYIKKKNLVWPNQETLAQRLLRGISFFILMMMSFYHLSILRRS